MATFYLDFENGNDANDGTTFANRWKSLTSGATAARIAPGDIIRIMGSPAPTSLGINGTWTSGALQATKSITGATNATPISITCTGHGYSTGDTVVITSVGGNTNANGTWEITNTGANTFTLDGSSGNAAYTSGGTARLRNNTRVKLASAVTQNIACCGQRTAAWTASSQVTATLNTTTKEHYQSDSIAIATNFTTGKAAYWATGTLNLSGYQQVSFWIQQTAGTVGAAGAIDLRLCSDTTGTTAVNTISIPNLVATGRWMPVTVDLGTSLGSSIQSIALYVNTDNAAQTFLLSNIIACKASSAADSLTLTSLIGKNTTGETFWGIQSINGTRVMLDADTNATPTSTTVRGYCGTSETVTTWKRETIKSGPLSTTAQTIQDDGTEIASIAFSGGWDRTNMSTQNLETWLDGVNGNAGFLSLAARSFLSFEKFAFTRFSTAIDAGTAKSVIFNLIAANNCTSGVFTGALYGGTSAAVSFLVDHIVANASLGIYLSGYNQSLQMGYLVASNAENGIKIGANGPCTVQSKLASSSFTIANNSSSAIAYSSSFTGKNIVTINNTNGIATTTGFNCYLLNCLINETTETSLTNNYANAFIYSQKHDQTTDNHKVFTDNGLISSATDQRHTASGISWKIQPTSAFRSSTYPLVLSLAKVACAANSLVTIKAWMRRDNTGLTMRLVCKGGQINGVTSDVVSAMTAAADTWEQLTITFTPTEIGVVEITAEAWGGTTYSGWVDDMTISQA